MTDEQLRQLSAKIAAEKDPKKLAELTSELIRLLAEEQDTIKAKIRTNIRRSTIPPE